VGLRRRRRRRKCEGVERVKQVVWCGGRKEGIVAIELEW